MALLLMVGGFAGIGLSLYTVYGLNLFALAAATYLFTRRRDSVARFQPAD